MYVYYPSNEDCENVALDPSCNPCLDYEKARIRSIALVHKSYYPILMEDPTDPEIWKAGILSGLIKVIPEVLGSTDGGAEKTGPGYGDNTETLLGFDFAPVIKDPNYKGNALFWDSVSGKTPYHFAYRTETQIHIASNPATIIVKAPVEESLDANVDWNITAKWFQERQVIPHDTPEGIFDNCFQLAQD